MQLGPDSSTVEEHEGDSYTSNDAIGDVRIFGNVGNVYAGCHRDPASERKTQVSPAALVAGDIRLLVGIIMVRERYRYNPNCRKRDTPSNEIVFWISATTASALPCVAMVIRTVDPAGVLINS